MDHAVVALATGTAFAAVAFVSYVLHSKRILRKRILRELGRGS